MCIYVSLDFGIDYWCCQQYAVFAVRGFRATNSSTAKKMMRVETLDISSIPLRRIPLVSNSNCLI